MAEKFNAINTQLLQILSDTANGQDIAEKIAQAYFWLEVQLANDYELIKDRILRELNQMNGHNIELKKVAVEAILVVVLRQFEERKVHALANYQRTTERWQNTTP